MIMRFGVRRFWGRWSFGYGWDFGVRMGLWGMEVPTFQIEIPDQAQGRNSRSSPKSKLQIKTLNNNKK